MKRRASIYVAGVAKVLVVLAALVAIGLAIDRALGLPGFSFPQIFGALLVIAAAAIEAWAHHAFWSAGGTPDPRWPPPARVTQPPYAWLRHPMYVARVTALVGIGLWLGSTGTLAVAGTLALIVAFWIVPRERARLDARFGGVPR